MYSLASFIDIITVLEQSLVVKNWVVSKSAHMLLMFGLNAVITSPGFIVFIGGGGNCNKCTLCVMGSSVLVFKIYSESNHFLTSMAATLVPEKAQK